MVRVGEGTPPTGPSKEPEKGPGGIAKPFQMPKKERREAETLGAVAPEEVSGYGEGVGGATPEDDIRKISDELAALLKDVDAAISQGKPIDSGIKNRILDIQKELAHVKIPPEWKGAIDSANGLLTKVVGLSDAGQAEDMLIQVRAALTCAASSKSSDPSGDIQKLDKDFADFINEVDAALKAGRPLTLDQKEKMVAFRDRLQQIYRANPTDPKWYGPLTQADGFLMAAFGAGGDPGKIENFLFQVRSALIPLPPSASLATAQGTEALAQSGIAAEGDIATRRG